MDDNLKKIEYLREWIATCASLNKHKVDEVTLHIGHLQPLAMKAGVESDKLAIEETIEFLETERQMHEKIFQDATHALKDIKTLTSLIEACDLCETKDGMQILDVQERERRKFASELHDSTVQSISSLIYKAEFCSKIIDSDIIKAKLELQIIIKSLRDIVKEMRDTIYSIIPTVVQEENLDALLEKHINHLNLERADINFTYQWSGKKRKIKSICCMTLFRIIQEACANAVKHSKANTVSISTTYEKNKVVITVRDNGIGFSLDKGLQDYVDEEHFGISIMKERAKLLCGELVIHSEISVGTQIDIHVENVYSDEGEEDDSY